MWGGGEEREITLSEDSFRQGDVHVAGYSFQPNVVVLASLDCIDAYVLRKRVHHWQCHVTLPPAIPFSRGGVVGYVWVFCHNKIEYLSTPEYNN